MAQHALGMVACGLGFDHGGLARGIKARQQDGALHLRRGDRKAVLDRHHLVGTDDGERHATALAGLEAGAHLRQRPDDPLHRPAAQRGIAGHEAGEAMAGQDAGKQARRRPGITEVQHIVGLACTTDAKSAHAPRTAAFVLDLGAQRPQGGGRRQHVLTLQEAGDRVSPRARAPNIRERWETDLSPGARTRPCNRSTGRAMSFAGAA